MWSLCEVLEVLGVWLWIITFQVLMVVLNLQLSTLGDSRLQPFAIHTHVTVFWPAEEKHVLPRQIWGNGYQPWILKINFFVSEKFIFKKSPNDPNLFKDALQRCLSKSDFSSEKEHSELHNSDEVPFRLLTWDSQNDEDAIKHSMRFLDGTLWCCTSYTVQWESLGYYSA